MPDAFATPEEAALAEWADHPQAKAQVVSVEYLDADNAVVVTTTDPDYPMWNYVSRTPHGWTFTHDHN